MAKTTRIAWSLPLFEEMRPSPNREALRLLFPEPRISFSGATDLRECPRLFYLSGPGARGGWFEDAPELVRKAHEIKSIKNAYAILGVEAHQFTARVDFGVDIDSACRERTRLLPTTIERLRIRFERRFKELWEESVGMTWEKFRKDPKRTVWFYEHVAGWYNQRNAAEKRRYLWDWVRLPVEMYIELREQIRDGAAIDDWLVIEGHHLDRGLIVREEGERRGEAELRTTTIYPCATMNVHGETWQYGYTLDRLFYHRRKRLFYLIDLKMGKRKSRDRAQMRVYGALLIRANPEITPKNLVMRVANLAAAKEEVIADYLFDSDADVRRTLDEIREQCADFQGRLRRVSRVSIDDLLRVFPRSVVLDRHGRFCKPNFPSDTLVALPEHFPPDAATYRKKVEAEEAPQESLFTHPAEKRPPTPRRQRDILVCSRCPKVRICKEGSELVDLQWTGGSR